MTDYTIPADVGTYAQTGEDVLFPRTYVATANVGTYTSTFHGDGHLEEFYHYRLTQIEQSTAFGTVTETNAVRWWRR